MEDKRIRNPKNTDITKSLNIGLHASQGKDIARADADDISNLLRFEKQYLLTRLISTSVLVFFRL